MIKTMTTCFELSFKFPCTASVNITTLLKQIRHIFAVDNSGIKYDAIVQNNVIEDNKVKI